MNSKKEVQHVYLVGAKSLGAYGGYETFVYKLTEYHQNEKYGVYELLRYCMDRELLLRMYTSGAKFQRVDKPLAIFRVGGESCKCYYKTAFESMNVSIKYGFPKSLAFCKTIYNICNMYAISAAKKILRRR